MRIRLDPTLLQENGKTAVFMPLISGGSGEGYWNVGTGARWKFTTSATSARLRCYATQSQFPFTLVNPSPSLLCYRVNGVDYWTALADLGDNWYEMALPGGVAKTVEIFVPPTGVVTLGQAPLGVYPVEIEFNAPATAVAAVTGGNHRVIYGDSITTGMNASVAATQGYGGLMKRGLSDRARLSAAGTSVWKGTYSAGTLYAVGEYVAYSGSTWKKLTSAAAGTTPAIGANWAISGYDGRVSLITYGFRRLYDDTTAAGVYSPSVTTAFAASIAALVPTEIIFLIGVNDWFSGWSAASFQTAYTGLLNALGASSASAVNVRCYSPLLTTVREGTNGYGDTLDSYRTAVSNAVSATTHAHASFTNGKTILASGDLYDGLHPTTPGHLKLREALL